MGMNLGSCFTSRWLAYCYQVVGHELPINYISENAVGYEVPDHSDPIETIEGKALRVLLSHDLDIPMDS